MNLYLHYIFLGSFNILKAMQTFAFANSMWR